MDITAQARKAEELRKLHGGPKVLGLPNAWDVASARVLEELRFPAIATTSAGVAVALGGDRGYVSRLRHDRERYGGNRESDRGRRRCRLEPGRCNWRYRKFAGR